MLYDEVSEMSLRGTSLCSKGVIITRLVSVSGSSYTLLPTVDSGLLLWGYFFQPGRFGKDVVSCSRVSGLFLTPV